MHPDCSQPKYRLPDLRSAAVIHLSTHAFVDRSVSERSSVVFTQDNDPKEDGFLTLGEIMGTMDAAGFGAQMAARPGGMILCFTCRNESPAAEFDLQAQRRTEGASDPDDMLALADEPTRRIYSADYHARHELPLHGVPV